MKFNYEHQLFKRPETSHLIVILIILLISTPSRAQTKRRPLGKLQNTFITAPDSIQTSVYWYWVSDNISKQGVIKDLEAMKKVGINRAFIGNIGLDDVPYGKVKLFSAEWWDIMHTALKTATRLDIQIGIFNSPGWSQSGGPWVKPEQSMRYLSSSELLVKGPFLLHKKLVKPNSDFQDVKVIAYPATKDYRTDISSLKPALSSIPAVHHIGYLMDNNRETEVVFEPGKLFTLDIVTIQPYTARSLTIYPVKAAMRFEGEIQIKVNKEYHTIKHFMVDRSNSDLIVGFSPYNPAAISFPATTAKNFRLVLTNVSSKSGIVDIKLSSSPAVENYTEKTLAKMWQTPFPYWTAYQWLPQPEVNDHEYVIDPEKVIDISKYMSADGTLKWKIPPGKWVIERSGMTPTKVTNSPASPLGKGLETDKMSKKHIAAHFEAFLGSIMKRIPAEDRKTWKVTVEDSYETGGQNWTDDMLKKFKSRYGYDAMPYIPVLQGKVVGGEDRSDRFLWDLRRFIADNVADEYVGGLRDISHRHGLTTWLENYGHWGFPGEFLQYGGQSDEVSGEFWSEGNLGNIENRAASSAAHIYGKNRVSAESFTCGGAAYSRYPAMMKQRADRFFTEGINNTLLHVYIQQPDDNRVPGINAAFGNEFNRLNTWFYDMDVFLKYIKRCNMMLQQGKYTADVAYFISEDAPKMTGTQDPELPDGYSFDYINAGVIKKRLKVKEGKLVLPDGLNYRILVLPKLKTMRPELLSKIKDLVTQGAIVLGPKPSVSPSLQDYPKADLKVQQLANDLWGNINGTTIKIHHLGKGMIIEGMDLQQALDLLKVIPDVHTVKKDSVLFVHRTLKEGSIYFLSNQSSKSIQINPVFRISGKSPELWNAVTGSIRHLPAYSQTATTTTVPLQLSPLESVFIIFRDDNKTEGRNLAAINYPAPVKTVKINGQWSVNFDHKMRGPSRPVIFKSLTEWSKNDNDSIKYFSGTAHYHTAFNLSKIEKGEIVRLDLGEVKAIAKVKVNGIELGGVWTAPYQIDITKALKPGWNNLEVKVVNTWVNRLIGDSKLPAEERKTWTSHNDYNSKSKLESSGLLGPVKIEVIRY